MSCQASPQRGARAALASAQNLVNQVNEATAIVETGQQIFSGRPLVQAVHLQGAGLSQVDQVDLTLPVPVPLAHVLVDYDPCKKAHKCHASEKRVAMMFKTAIMYGVPERMHTHGEKGKCLVELANVLSRDTHLFPHGISANCVGNWIKRYCDMRKDAIKKAGGDMSITGAGDEDTDEFWEFYSTVGQDIVTFEGIDNLIDDYIDAERDFLAYKNDSDKKKAADDRQAQELMDEVRAVSE